MPRTLTLGDRNSKDYAVQPLIPTHLILRNRVRVTQKPVSEAYRFLAYVTNQGKNYRDAGFTILGERRRFESHSLRFAIKVANYNEPPGTFLTRLCHSNIVTLHEIFWHERRLSIVYEAMDFSLQQVFSVSVDPWSLSNSSKDELVGAAYHQVIRGVQYLHSHEITHGNIELTNILLDRNGTIKIANIGWSIIHEDLAHNTDFDQLFDVLCTLACPIRLERLEYPWLNIAQLCSQGRFSDALHFQVVRNTTNHGLAEVAEQLPLYLEVREKPYEGGLNI